MHGKNSTLFEHSEDATRDNLNKLRDVTQNKELLLSDTMDGPDLGKARYKGNTSGPLADGQTGPAINKRIENEVVSMLGTNKGKFGANKALSIITSGNMQQDAREDILAEIDSDVKALESGDITSDEFIYRGKKRDAEIEASMRDTSKRIKAGESLESVKYNQDYRHASAFTNIRQIDRQITVDSRETNNIVDKQLAYKTKVDALYGDVEGELANAISQGNYATPEQLDPSTSTPGAGVTSTPGSGTTPEFTVPKRLDITVSDPLTEKEKSQKNDPTDIGKLVLTARIPTSSAFPMTITDASSKVEDDSYKNVNISSSPSSKGPVDYGEDINRGNTGDKGIDFGIDINRGYTDEKGPIDFGIDIDSNDDDKDDSSNFKEGPFAPRISTNGIVSMTISDQLSKDDERDISGGWFDAEDTTFTGTAGAKAKSGKKGSGQKVDSSKTVEALTAKLKMKTLASSSYGSVETVFASMGIDTGDMDVQQREEAMELLENKELTPSIIANSSTLQDNAEGRAVAEEMQGIYYDAAKEMGIGQLIADNEKAQNYDNIYSYKDKNNLKREASVDKGIGDAARGYSALKPAEQKEVFDLAKKMKVEKDKMGDKSSFQKGILMSNTEVVRDSDLSKDKIHMADQLSKTQAVGDATSAKQLAGMTDKFNGANGLKETLTDIWDVRLDTKDKMNAAQGLFGAYTHKNKDGSVGLDAEEVKAKVFDEKGNFKKIDPKDAVAVAAKAATEQIIKDDKTIDKLDASKKISGTDIGIQMAKTIGAEDRMEGLRTASQGGEKSSESVVGVLNKILVAIQQLGISQPTPKKR